MNLREMIKRANHGNSEIQIWLGAMYERGYNRVNKDIEKAIFWYTKAAEQGNIDACNCLGNIYYYGRGVEQNTAKAIELWDRGFKKGNYYSTVCLIKAFKKIKYNKGAIDSSRQYGDIILKKFLEDDEEKAAYKIGWDTQF